MALYINNKSTLDLEEIMNKDAAIFYAKIPTGQSVSLTRSFGEGFDIGTGTMAYDVVSKEITLFDGYSTDTLSGFEGYIIIPLADAFKFVNVILTPFLSLFDPSFKIDSNLFNISFFSSSFFISL